MAGQVQDVELVGSTGARLSGVLHVPEQPRGSVLMAHCFTCSKDLSTMTRFARGLAERGYACLRFDFTGLGESGGAFSRTTVSTNIGDLAAAARELIQWGYGPCAMLGHSLGGAATLLAAHRVRTVRSLAVVGAPSTPQHVGHLFADAEDAIRREGEQVVQIGGRPFPISTAFLDDLGDHDQRARVAELDRPLLVVHAVDDTVVGVREGERIFAAARQPKGFLPLLGADHLLTDRAVVGRAVRAVADWFDATL